MGLHSDLTMTEDYYTLLMRKNISGMTTEEEDTILFDWLDLREEYFNFYAWLCLLVSAEGDPPLQAALTREKENDEGHEMSSAEFKTLVQRFWKEQGKRD